MSGGRVAQFQIDFYIDVFMFCGKCMLAHRICADERERRRVTFDA